MYLYPTWLGLAPSWRTVGTGAGGRRGVGGSATATAFRARYGNGSPLAPIFGKAAVSAIPIAGRARFSERAGQVNGAHAHAAATACIHSAERGLIQPENAPERAAPRGVRAIREHAGSPLLLLVQLFSPRQEGQVFDELTTSASARETSGKNRSYPIPALQAPALSRLIIRHRPC